MQVWFIIWTLMALFYAGLFFQKQIITYFNLVDKRMVIGQSAKMVELMRVADVDLGYNHYNFMKNATLRVKFGKDKDTVTKYMEGDSLDVLIDEAHAFAKTQGYIKE